MRAVVYLDNNATTRPTPGVVEAVVRGLRETWHNPSSVHRPGQAARREVELARAALADLVGAGPRELVLTSGGTEAIDLAIRGGLAALARPGGPPPVLVTTKVEHAAVRDLAGALEATGAARVRWCPLREGGIVDVAALAGLAAGGPTLVSVQWANNETGAVQPVVEVGAACRAAGAVFHTDATQWVGKMETDVRACGADLLTFSAHKFHGPKGVGALWARPGVRVRPTLVGTQELDRRGGTENVPGIMGAGVAAREARAWLEDRAARARLEALRDRFEALVRAGVEDAVVLTPPDGPRLWNTSSVAVPGLEAEAMLLGLSERGVCASAGAACSSGSLEPSPVLLAMGVPERVAHGALRFSLSRETTGAEVEEAARALVGVVRSLRGVNSA